MKFSKKKYQRYSLGSYTKTGRKNNFSAEIEYNGTYGYYYFMLRHKDGYVFNSLWKNLKYNSESECMNACEKFIDNLR